MESFPVHGSPVNIIYRVIIWLKLKMEFLGIRISSGECYQRKRVKAKHLFSVI